MYTEWHSSITGRKPLRHLAPTVLGWPSPEVLMLRNGDKDKDLLMTLGLFYSICLGGPTWADVCRGRWVHVMSAAVIAVQRKNPLNWPACTKLALTIGYL